MSTSFRATALVVVWSSGFIGAEFGARQAAPGTVLTWRCLIIALVLLPWSLRALTRLGRREWMRQAALALLCQCLYLGGVFWAAAAGVPAGTSALIASLQPAVVLVVAALLEAQRLRPAHLAGLALGTTGVALVAAGDLRAGVTVTALVLPLGAMLSLTAGTLLQQRWSARPARSNPSLTQTLAVQSVFTAAFFTLVTAGTAGPGGLEPPLTTGFWIAVGWGVVVNIGSYALYYLITARDGAARASTLLYLTPATTALWAAPMFGQPVRVVTVLGLLISISAVALLRDAGRGPRERPADPPEGRREDRPAGWPRPPRRPPRAATAGSRGA